MINSNNFFVGRNSLREHGPLLISHDMLPNGDGNNINGPSLIKVPSWVDNPLGKYYLYFAHHGGKYIRLAYSDEVTGPYKIYEQGTLHLNQIVGHNHLASPDVHIDNKNKEIVMYYHAPYEDWQYTFKAKSKDGLNFESEDKKLGMFYFRVFEWKGRTFSIAKNRNTTGISYELIDDEWVVQKEDFIPMMRHAAVLVENDKVYVFYTIVGEAPESIYCSEIDIDNGWKLKDTELLLKPEYQYEGSNLPLIPSRFGNAEIVNELRDPCIFTENNDKYILYSVAGECGIAMGKLYNINSNIKKYDVWGMRRTGNHAIIEWISSHFNKTLHRNDVVKSKPWLIKEYGGGEIIDLTIDSYEDFAPTEIKENTIILLRDWYNMCASRLVSKRGWRNSCRYNDEISYIRSCAEVYLEYCKLWEKYPDNFILYNKWCNDDKYEKEIEKRYNWKRVPRNNNLPSSKIGGGSSFKKDVVENTSFDERYLDVIKNYPDEWIDICSNEEINNYCNKIFGLKIEW